MNLQLQIVMFYPNAYLNFDNNGNYTKHYYNGTERIVSRLGTENIVIANDDEDFEERRNHLRSHFNDDIQELLYAEENIDMSLSEIAISYFQPTDSTQNDIFYYHTNHLGSTAFVTDNNSSITQGFVYAPFGEIISEYNANFGNEVIPKYSFNAKELDEETGMYYFEARYYRAPTFISRDPLMNEKPWLTPYHYCSNNPVGRIDPTGMMDDEWEFSAKGEIKNVGQSDRDIFYKVDENGHRTGEKLEFENRIVNGEMTLSRKNGKQVKYLEIGDEKSAQDLFEFLSHNTTEESTEWGYTIVKDNSGCQFNTIGVNVIHEKGSTSANIALFENGFEIVNATHNHPNNNPRPSNGDIDVATIIQNKYPGATFSNYTIGHGYTRYDKNTERPILTIKTPEIKVFPK